MSRASTSTGVAGHAGLPALAPLAQRDHRRQQREALVGQPILDLAAILGQRLARQDAVLDQPRETVGQDVARDAELRLELLEMVQAVERRAQDHERPALAHRLERGRQAAFDQIAQRFPQVSMPIRIPLFSAQRIAFQLS